MGGNVKKFGEESNYCITKANACCHELIGLDAKIIGGSCTERNKISGKVVDETKNTFTISTENGEKIVPKSECVFEFDLGKNGRVVINGKNILKKPEDRAKEWRN
ncbi:MAG: ribonuclease P protein subunit [archaeon]